MPRSSKSTWLFLPLLVASCSTGRDSRTENLPTLRFLVVGDTQDSDSGGMAECVPQLIADMRRRDPDFVAFTGDLVCTGSTQTLSEWKELTAAFGERRYMVPGNDDLPGRPASNEDWQQLFSWLPKSQPVPNITTSDGDDTITGVDGMDYYFDPSPDVRVISVTTDRDALPGEQHTHSGGYEIIGGEPRAMDWFLSVMALPSTKAKRWLFVMTHHPVTTSMSEFGAPEHFGLQAGTPTRWWRSISGQNGMYDLAQADALLTGHVHGYYPNHPDPHVHTAEMIVGTGGGKSSGVPHRSLHGFVEIAITGDRATCAFVGDKDGARGGWSFTDVLDTFELTNTNSRAKGLRAHFEFEPHDPTRNFASDELSKGHRLRVGRGAEIRDSTLYLDGKGLADAKNVGDQNLQLLSDLHISVHAKADGSLGRGAVDNVLVAFGDADGSKWNGTWARMRAEEIANDAYVFSYHSDGRLRLAWEYHDDPKADSPPKRQVVTSTEAILSPGAWHRLEVLRRANDRLVEFRVDGVRLGKPVKFEHLPTGGGAGSLYLGGLPNSVTPERDAIATFAGWLDDVRISDALVR